METQNTISHKTIPLNDEVLAFFDKDVPRSVIEMDGINGGRLVIEVGYEKSRISATFLDSKRIPLLKVKTNLFPETSGELTLFSHTPLESARKSLTFTVINDSVSTEGAGASLPGDSINLDSQIAAPIIERMREYKDVLFQKMNKRKWD